MAVGAFPLVKLGIVLVKQISKPIANGIASRATKSKAFRDYVCIPVAQFFHWYDVKIRMRVLNLGKVTNVPKLDEKKAIETGAQLLSEFILVAIASSLVILEYRRQSEKEEVRQREVEAEKAETKGKITDLEFALQKQSTQIRELTRLTFSIRDDIQKLNNSKRGGGFFGGSKGNHIELPPIPSALQGLDLDPEPPAPVPSEADFKGGSNGNGGSTGAGSPVEQQHIGGVTMGSLKNVNFTRASHLWSFDLSSSYSA